MVDYLLKNGVKRPTSQEFNQACDNLDKGLEAKRRAKEKVKEMRWEMAEMIGRVGEMEKERKEMRRELEEVHKLVLVGIEKGKAIPPGFRTLDQLVDIERSQAERLALLERQIEEKRASIERSKALKANLGKENASLKDKLDTLKTRLDEQLGQNSRDPKQKAYAALKTKLELSQALSGCRVEMLRPDQLLITLTDPIELGIHVEFSLKTGKVTGVRIPELPGHEQLKPLIDRANGNIPFLVRVIKEHLLKLSTKSI